MRTYNPVGVAICISVMRYQSEPVLLGVEMLVVAGKHCGYRVVRGQGNARQHVKSFAAVGYTDEHFEAAFQAACLFASIYNCT